MILLGKTRKPRKRNIVALLACTALAGLAGAAMPHSAHAADAIWGGPGSTPTNDNYSQDNNWSSQSAPVGAGSSAVFSGSGPQTVVVTGTVAPDSWSISGPNAYAISGGTVNFATTAGLANTSSANQSIGTVLGGAGATVTQNGSATLTLSGINTYTGATTISAGKLALSGSGSIANSSGISVGGTFDISATTTGASVQTLTGAGDVVLGDKTLTVTAASGDYSGVMSGTGGLTINGGSQTLSGVNTYTGATNIGGGTTLTLTGSGSIATSSSVQASGTLDISGTTSGASIKTLTGGGKVILGSKTLTITAASGNFVNVIEGTGGLTIAGGTQKLDGMNTFTGKTTIDSGATLALTGQGRVDKSSGVEVNGTFDVSAAAAASIKSLTGSGTVELGATSLMLSAASGTFSGVIHGTAGLGLNGGTLILTGENDFSGSVGISSGATLQIGSGGTTGSIVGNVGNYGTLAFNRSDELTYAGNITGAKTGLVTVSGGGKLILTGSNSSNGVVIDSGSTLQFGNGGTTGMLGGVNPGGISNSGALIYKLAGQQQFRGVLTGSGTVEQAGTGSLILTGDSSGFTGSTTVSSGSLIVGLKGVGKLGGDVEVMSGASLGGSGTIGGDVTILAGGAHVIGDASATPKTPSQTVSGDYVNHGALEIEGSPSATDKLTVGGTVDITGATLKLVLSPPTAADWDPLNGPFTIIDKQSAGAVTGTFASIENNLLFLDDTVDYAGGDGNDVTLSLTRNDLSVVDVADTANQKAVGGAVDQLGTGNPLGLAILLLSDEDTARLALDAISGEAQASLKGMFVQDSHFVMDAATNRVRSAVDGVATASIPVMAYGEGGPELVAADSNRFVVWGQAFGSWADVKGDGNAAGFDRSTGGFIAGGDGAIGDTWRLGVLAGYSRSSFSADDRASSGSSDNYHLGLYGGGQWGAFGLRAGAAYSWHNIETGRTVGLPGFADTLSATYDAGTAQVYGEAGYRIDTSAASFEPFANLAYVNLHTDGFTENGGAAALSASASNTDTTFSTLGVRASTDLSLGSVPVTARGTLGWRHAFGSVTPTSQLAFAGSDPFSIAGTPIARDAAVVEAGIDLAVSGRATLGLTYSGQFGSGSTDNGFKARFGVEF
ncbi:autotransporter domain-containing protein [Mesorhizobium sp. B2-3-4]|uniref:autotransporter domain-containing protein n=1 Tax=Mesorhizobium sp. B2-3-4 TaxID=2589959 RepID=UPI001127E021|nr:autotransporter domain-containing protein [Mesorhizobium sp. B2-3-4]TPM38102.1 autotransporter domain-containing protein [Mesorhizobium sp. B2-3-4]